MATSRIFLPGKLPWTEELGRLQSMGFGSQIGRWWVRAEFQVCVWVKIQVRKGGGGHDCVSVQVKDSKSGLKE